MPTVIFTSHLQRFFPDLKQGSHVEGSTVAEVVAALEREHPGFADYVIDEHRKLRKHVNIFIGENLIQDRNTLQDAVPAEAQVFIMQALSGG